MSRPRVEKYVRAGLYVSLGVLALVCLSLPAVEFFSPWIVRKIYAQEAHPAINSLISDRSYPLQHFQRFAPLVYYNGITPLFSLSLVAALTAWGYLNRGFLKKAIAPFARYISQLPRAYRWTIFAFIGLLLTAQVVDQNRLTFPITSWKVYGHTFVPPQIVYHQFYGRTADGDTVRINPEVLFRAAEGIIYHRLENWAEALHEHRVETWRKNLKVPSEHTSVGAYEWALYKIGRQYERRHDRNLAEIFVRRIRTAPIHADSTWRKIETLHQVKMNPELEHRTSMK